MIAQIFYKESADLSLNIHLIDMNLPMCNKEFNNIIEENNLFSFENINNSYNIVITLNDFSYKIICNTLMEANAVYFITREIENLNLYNDLCVYSKYSSNFKDKNEISGYNYIDTAIYVIDSSNPDSLNKFKEDFKIHSNSFNSNYFKHSGNGYFFSDENEKYVFSRVDKMCDSLRIDTNLIWSLEDPSICANINILPEDHAYIPKRYFSEYKLDDNYDDSLFISINTIEDTYDIHMEFEGFNSKIKYDPNIPMELYNENKWNDLHTVTHTYDDTIAFIKKGLAYYKKFRLLLEKTYFDYSYEDLKSEYSIKYRENHKSSDFTNLENKLYGFVD